MNLCSANVGGDPASGCESDAEPGTDLCARHGAAEPRCGECERRLDDASHCPECGPLGLKHDGTDGRCDCEASQ